MKGGDQPVVKVYIPITTILVKVELPPYEQVWVEDIVNETLSISHLVDVN